jgi:hypothetical protein
MLTEQIFEELTRNTPLREQLITAAWPGLSVESKLQIIQYLVTNMQSPPDWLTYIATNDDSAIVKFWSLKDADLQKPDSEKTKNSGMDFYNSAIESNEPIVKTLATNLGLYGFEHMNEATQLARLIHIRFGGSQNLSLFMSWIEQAIENGIPDEELSECCQEYLNLKSVNEELSTVDFEEGYDAYIAGKGIETAWNIIKKAGPLLTTALLYKIPTSLGLKTISVETLCEMPERVISSFPYWNFPSKEINQVIELMTKFPERFPEKSIQSLNNKFNYYLDLSSEQVQLEQLHKNPEPLKVIQNKVLKLQETILNLEEKIDKLTKKRGFFL